MAEIALYNVLTKLGLLPDEAEKAVVDVASSKEVATKADLQIGLSELKAELKYMRWVLGLLFVMNIAIFVKLFF